MRFSRLLPTITVATLTASTGVIALPKAAVPDSAPTKTTPEAPPIPTLKASNTQTSIYPTKILQLNLLWWWIFGDIPYFSTNMYGTYGPCYNLVDPIPARNTGSFKVVGESPTCWIFRKADCKGEFTEVKKGAGVAIYDGASLSFICDPPVKRTT